MNKRRLQELAGIVPRSFIVHEADNSEQYMQWEELAAEEFLQKNPHVNAKVDELEIEDDGGVYHRKSNQRWPENTVTPFDQWRSEQEGDKTDATNQRGNEQGWKTSKKQSSNGATK